MRALVKQMFTQIRNNLCNQIGLCTGYPQALEGAKGGTNSIRIISYQQNKFTAEI